MMRNGGVAIDDEEMDNEEKMRQWHTVAVVTTLLEEWGGYSSGSQNKNWKNENIILLIK